MKKFLMLVLCVFCLPGLADTPKIIMISHGNNADPFWHDISRGAEQAAKQYKVDFQHYHSATGDIYEMVRLIDAALPTKPSGIIISIPDPYALKAPVAKIMAHNIPLITINSGEDAAKQWGVSLHVGQSEYNAGFKAGQEHNKLGVTNGVCINHEIQNVALEARCKGYADGLGIRLKMLDVGADPIDIRNRTMAYLSADKSIDGIFTLGATTANVIIELLAKTNTPQTIRFSTFDIDPAITKAIKNNIIDFALDQQQYLQGYLPVMSLAMHVHNGLEFKGFIESGPRFVNKSNLTQAEKSIAF